MDRYGDDAGHIKVVEIFFAQELDLLDEDDIWLFKAVGEFDHKNSTEIVTRMFLDAGVDMYLLDINKTRNVMDFLAMDYQKHFSVFKEWKELDPSSDTDDISFGLARRVEQMRFFIRAGFDLRRLSKE